MRQREDRLLRQLASRLPMKQKANTLYNDPHVKVNILLQAHFSRMQLTPELQSDQTEILRLVLRFVAACVDVLSSSLWLEPALAAMELSQMIVQATWASDPLLKQVPHLDSAALKRAASKEVDTIFDLTDLEDQDRDAVLKLPQSKLMDVARFCNRYPNVDLEHQVEDADSIHSGQPVVVSIALARDEDDKEEEAPPVGPVIAPFFPQRKDETWWVVIGSPTENKYVRSLDHCTSSDVTFRLVAIKRVPLQHRANVQLPFDAPSQGDHTLKVFLMCDSYLGCDQEYEIKLSVKEALAQDDDDDMSEEEDE